MNVLREGGVLHHHRKTAYKVGPLEVTGLLPRQNDVAVPDRILDKLDDPDRSESSKRGVASYVASVERFNAAHTEHR